MEKASLIRRWLAYFIDSIILGLASGLISPLIGGRPVLWGLIGILIPAIYFVWFYSTSGQTVGKRVMGIRVISIDGSPLNWHTGVLRTFGYVLSSIPFGFGFLVAIWDKNKQAGHDKIAGTYVVPISAAQQPFQGYVEPSKVHSTQRRWLVGLGIASLITVAAFFSLFAKGLGEVSAMGPWPGQDVSPADVVDVDLSGLGLKAGQIQNARSAGDWTKGDYERGVFITFGAGAENVVTIWALRYANANAASHDFSSTQEWADTHCPATLRVQLLGSGVIHCQFSDAYDKIFWNDYWIVDIVAGEGTKLTPDVLVDQVRDALAAHWKDIIQTKS